MSVAFTKVKSAAKVVLPKGRKLSDTVKKTVDTVSSIVGATMGPGGSAVLIERQEYGVPNFVTKDGVTVFRSLGFSDPIQHAVMEAMRDASVRTATEAGDGTTTATVLAAAIINGVSDFCEANQSVSPQLILRTYQSLFADVVEPEIKKMSKSVGLETDEDRSLLLDVARISANGDTDLAEAVMKCYDLVGDNGNVTITEASGPNKYEVEKLNGFPIASGYEESCGRYSSQFINDPASSRVVLDNPAFIIYNGRISDFQSLVPLLMQIGAANSTGVYNKKNVVVVATAFSESALQDFAVNFPVAGTLNVYPLTAPHSPAYNGQTAFLEDLSAITGAEIFSAVDRPLDGPNVELEVFGNGIELFEANRFRSNVIQQVDADGDPANAGRIIDRSFILEGQISTAESQLDAELLRERLAKLTGGIARLKVLGSSSAEIRERKDRAEDAVMAVRGALKHGVLPGGGWALLRTSEAVAKSGKPYASILADALSVPFKILLQNAGQTPDVVLPQLAKKPKSTYDVLKQTLVPAYTGGVLDSTPAVLEAIRNSIAISTLLGTLGGAVVFPRDAELERRESHAAHEYLRNAGEPNPADERG